ncbi:MAG: DUF3068 domain-containing protein [Micrococcales bacterium]|nr:DUF3068 domain-containing protein [Micrococcales bacterium]
MRRVLGFVLIGLGALFLGLGILAKPYLYKGLATVPLNQDSTSVSEGRGMSVLYAHVADGAPAVDKLTDVDVKSTREIRGIPGRVPADQRDKNVFWQTTVRSQAMVDGAPVDLSYSDAGVSLDRVSAEASNCCGDYRSVGDLTDPTKTENATYEGLYFKFPFDVQQRDYQWYDTTLKRAEPIKFVKQDSIDGTPVYVFEQKLGPEAVQTIDAPASLFSDGASGDVTATEMYSNTRTLWVEPVTGVLIDGREQINDVYQAEGYDPVAKTVGTIGFNEQTVSANAKDWGAKAKLLSFIDHWVLLVGVVIGILLLALGGFLVLAGSPTRPAPGPRADTRERARA